MPLPNWLSELTDARIAAGEPAPVTAVCFDSRAVIPGALFVAVPGFDVEGHEYISDALARGATALLVQEDRRPFWEPHLASGAAIVSTPDTRLALSAVAAAFNDHPGRKLGVVGVTGTDGKTTVTHLLGSVLQSAGLPTGYLSSVEFKAGADAILNASHMTTLEAPEVQSMMARMVEAGNRYAVVEASSHGLALHRVDACEFDIGIFTNLSRDHLDFHGSIDEYREAKGLLFKMLDTSFDKGISKSAVLNADDPVSNQLRTMTSRPIITYGIDLNADFRARRVSARSTGITFTLEHGDQTFDVKSKLMGRFNVYNCLATLAAGNLLGLAIPDMLPGLAKFAGVPGRMESIDEGQEFKVLVDIASTPKALTNVLNVLRPVTLGKLWAVFGAAGERDPARRDGMGKAAAELADFTVITNEDPRTEDADAIIEQIAAGLRQSGRNEGDDFIRIPDRREAIRYAFEHAEPDDVVLLAGKGTEQSIVIGREHIPWDERTIARDLLKPLLEPLR